MSSMIDRASPDSRSATIWLCLCPLLAVAATWQVALMLAACLLITIMLTAGGLAIVRSILPLAALLAGTFAVLEQLALAAWWPTLDAAAAPWLALVAGLAVLVCCFDESFRGGRTLTPAPLPVGEGSKTAAACGDFSRAVKWALSLSMTLLIIGVVRDGFGRVFLLAETPVGALVLLALLLAGINFVTRGSTGSSHLPAWSPLGPGLRRDDEPPRSATGLRRDDEQPRSEASLRGDDKQSPSAAGLRRNDENP